MACAIQIPMQAASELESELVDVEILPEEMPLHVPLWPPSPTTFLATLDLTLLDNA